MKVKEKGKEQGKITNAQQKKKQKGKGKPLNRKSRHENFGSGAEKPSQSVD